MNASQEYQGSPNRAFKHDMAVLYTVAVGILGVAGYALATDTPDASRPQARHSNVGTHHRHHDHLKDIGIPADLSPLSPGLPLPTPDLQH